MAKKQKVPERQEIVVRIPADTQRLYGSIDGAISYLQEMREEYGPGVSLEEDWTGYSDMEMTFVYTRYETDDEMQRRLELEAARRRLDEEEARRKKERAKDVAEFERLKKKLGV